MPLGEWVLDRACEQLADWHDAYGVSFYLSVNASTLQFRQADFVNVIKQNIDRHAIAPNTLQIEITESMLMDDIEHAQQLLNQLQAIGVSIAIDDFGTGYSSMKYLKNLPISSLKIDRSFVAEMAQDKRDAGIVDAIIALSHHLGLKVVAEGVETDVQLQMLENSGCDLFQGHYFRAPATAQDFIAWYREYSSAKLRSLAAM